MIIPTSAPAPQIAGTRWTLEPAASSVEFHVRQFWGLSTVHGRFDAFEGELLFASDGSGRAMLYIDASTVATGNRRRDRHLRTNDYFDCEHHPYVRFVADATIRTATELRLVGELHAGGRSVPLDLAAAINGEGDRLELSAIADIDARALDMSWSPAGRLRTPVTLDVCARLRRAA